MTRETKLGIVVAGAFVTLLTVVVYHKMQESDSPPTDSGQVLRQEPNPTPPKKTVPPTPHAEKKGSITQAEYQAPTSEQPHPIPPLPAVPLNLVPPADSGSNPAPVPTPTVHTGPGPMSVTQGNNHHAGNSGSAPSLPPFVAETSETKVPVPLPPGTSVITPAKSTLTAPGSVHGTESKKTLSTGFGSQIPPVTVETTKGVQVDVVTPGIRPVSATQTEAIKENKGPALPPLPSVGNLPVVTSPVVPPPTLQTGDHKQQEIIKTLKEEKAKSEKEEKVKSNLGGLSALPTPPVPPLPPVDNKHSPAITPIPPTPPVSPLPGGENKTSTSTGPLLSVPPVGPLSVDANTKPSSIPSPTPTVPPLPGIENRTPPVPELGTKAQIPPLPELGTKTPPTPGSENKLVPLPGLADKTSSAVVPNAPVPPVTPGENKTSSTLVPVPPTVPTVPSLPTGLENKTVPTIGPLPPTENKSSANTTPKNGPTSTPLLIGPAKESVSSVNVMVPPNHSTKPKEPTPASAELAAKNTTGKLPVDFVPFDSKKAANYAMTSKVTVTEVENYKCQEDDISFEAVSKKKYTSAKYARALQAYNKDYNKNLQEVFKDNQPILKPGMIVQIPTIPSLESESKYQILIASANDSKKASSNSPQSYNLVRADLSVPTVSPSIAKPVAPTNPPQTVGPPSVTVTEVENYKCQADDTSFEAVSQKKYASPNFARALQAYNKDYNKYLQEVLKDNQPVLKLGMIVQIPTIASLRNDAKYNILLPQHLVPTPSPNGTNSYTVSNSQSLPKAVPLPNAQVAPLPANGNTGVLAVNTMALEGQRQYQVQGSGEKMYEIAQKTLGNGESWPEIYRLNPQVQPSYLIPGGTILRLP